MQNKSINMKVQKNKVNFKLINNNKRWLIKKKIKKKIDL